MQLELSWQLSVEDVAVLVRPSMLGLAPGRVPAAHTKIAC